MYQKLVIREADAHLRRVQNKGRARKKPLTLAGRSDSNPDRMIICSDWPTILRCNTAFGQRMPRVRERERERDRV